MTGSEPYPITVKRLPSGYWHIRGRGPLNWAQPPYWPCPEDVLREHAFCQAGEEFLAAASRLTTERTIDA